MRDRLARHAPPPGVPVSSPCSVPANLEGCPLTQVSNPNAVPQEVWRGKAYPLGAYLRRLRHELRAVQRGRRACRAVPVRRRRHRDPDHAARGRRVRLARLPPQHRAGPALRLPRARALRPRRRPPVQPEQAAAGPLRQGDRRHLRLEPVAVRLRLRRSGQPQRRRLGGEHAEVGGDQPVLRLGHRPPAEPRVRRHRHLRGARQGPHRDSSRYPRTDARHLRRRRAPGDHRAPDSRWASRRSSSCRCTTSPTTRR